MLSHLQYSQFSNYQRLVKDAAWRQIASSGSASISLEGIAHDLRISNEEIGNYFPKRNDLVTALMIDAHASFGDYQIASRESFPGVAQFLQRFMATCMAYREWAMQYPERYALLFGPPVPGYKPPFDVLRPVMIRSISALISVINELRATKLLNVDSMPLIDPSALEGYFWGSSSNSKDEVLALTLAMVIRSRLHGMVSLEMTGQLQMLDEEGNSLYDFEIKSLVRQFIDI